MQFRSAPAMESVSSLKVAYPHLDRPTAVLSTSSRAREFGGGDVAERSGIQTDPPRHTGGAVIMNARVAIGCNVTPLCAYIAHG